MDKSTKTLIIIQSSLLYIFNMIGEAITITNGRMRSIFDKAFLLFCQKVSPRDYLNVFLFVPDDAHVDTGRGKEFEISNGATNIAPRHFSKTMTPCITFLLLQISHLPPIWGTRRMHWACTAYLNL